MPRHELVFHDEITAQQKFEKHGGLLSTDSVEEYVTLASSFLGCPLESLVGIEECQRPNGDWVRYNVRARLVGFMSEDRATIFTYYIIEPHKLRGRTVRGYCEDQCRREYERA
jgi:pyocin large subunit-like protein